MQVPWRKALPPRRGWLRLLASPTSALLIAGLLMTIQGKARILRGVEDISAWPLVLVWAIAMDLFVYLGFAALFAVGEGHSPWMRLATYPLTLLIASIALCNAWYLSVTGEQLTWEAISLGFDRFSDLWAITAESVLANRGKAAVVVVALIGAPLLIRWQLRRSGPWDRHAHALERAHCAALLAALGLVIALVAPAPAALPAERLGGNATLRSYWGWLTTDVDDTSTGFGGFEGYTPPHLVHTDEIARAATGPRPNILLVVLESTRWDYTSLAAADTRGAETPALAALARTGTSARRARAVLPHTTKSLFSMLCGRFPTMQAELVEYSAKLEVQCVPAILAAAGYRTGFFQSALGMFEHRPRLVDKLGYQHFESWEDIQGEELGYLASDDESLAPAVIAWLDATAADGRPFFATVLTSATHHPYRLPTATITAARAAGRPTDSDEQRYARLVEAEDRVLAALVAALDARGLRQNTIIIAVGDHGEGFGTKGVRQHDNNFYEEGLHVPLVIAGPGVPVGEIAENVTLADMTPTLLGRLGIRIAADAAPTLPGTDLFAGPVPPDRVLFFSCWYELRCRGFVAGDHKVVFVPDTGRAWRFDLAADPRERDALPLTGELRDFVPVLNRTLDAFRTHRWPMVLGATRDYGAWRCQEGRLCTHPKTHKIRLQ